MKTEWSSNLLHHRLRWIGGELEEAVAKVAGNAAHYFEMCTFQSWLIEKFVFQRWGESELLAIKEAIKNKTHVNRFIGLIGYAANRQLDR